MKPPHQDLNQLLKNLAGEAADLPRLAASEARQVGAQRDRNRRRLAHGLILAFIGICSWQVWHRFGVTWRSLERTPDLVRQSVDPPMPHPKEFVRVRTMEEDISQPIPLPPGASQEQKDLLEAARGLPLLLVMDDSGNLARIHVIKRDPPAFGGGSRSDRAN